MDGKGVILEQPTGKKLRQEKTLGKLETRIRKVASDGFKNKRTIGRLERMPGPNKSPSWSAGNLEALILKKPLGNHWNRERGVRKELLSQALFVKIRAPLAVRSEKVQREELGKLFCLGCFKLDCGGTRVRE